MQPLSSAYPLTNTTNEMLNKLKNWIQKIIYKKIGEFCFANYYTIESLCKVAVYLTTANFKWLGASNAPDIYNLLEWIKWVKIIIYKTKRENKTNILCNWKYMTSFSYI